MDKVIGIAILLGIIYGLIEHTFITIGIIVVLFFIIAANTDKEEKKERELTDEECLELAVGEIKELERQKKI